VDEIFWSRRFGRSAGLLAVVFAVGCAGRSAPHSPAATVETRTPGLRGAWITVALHDGSDVHGEWIASGPDGLRVLSGAALRRVAITDIRDATLILRKRDDKTWPCWKPDSKSTLNDGGWPALSVWCTGLVGGGGSTAPALHADGDIEIFLAANRRFARFPEGLPEGADAAALGFP
jgi:hypothetical protein